MSETADDERLQPQGSGLGAIEERKRSERDDGEHEQRDLEVGVGDDRLGVQFQEPVSGLGGDEEFCVFGMANLPTR